MPSVTIPADPALKPVQERLIAKLRTKGLVSVRIDDDCVRHNPYSGVQVQLCPLAASLCDWIVSPRRGHCIDQKLLSRNDWDRARMLFLALWPDAYYDLID
jgi:hypothetical protein